MRMLVADADSTRVERVEMILRLRWPDARITRATDGWQALETVLGSELALVVVNPRLRYAENRSLLRDVRRISPVPIVLLVAQPGEADRIDFGKLGAVDYVVAPPSPVELLTRVEAAMHLASSSDTLTSAAERRLRWSDGYLSIDFARSRAWLCRAPVTLAAAEFRLLSHLVLNVGKVVSERCLLRLVLGHDRAEASDCLGVFVRRLRDEIEPDPDAPRYIVEERGAGYRFVRAPLRRSRWSVLPTAEPASLSDAESDGYARVLTFRPLEAQSTPVLW